MRAREGPEHASVNNDSCSSPAGPALLLLLAAQQVLAAAPAFSLSAAAALGTGTLVGTFHFARGFALVALQAGAVGLSRSVFRSVEPRAPKAPRVGCAFLMLLVYFIHEWQQWRAEVRLKSRAPMPWTHSECDAQSRSTSATGSNGCYRVMIVLCHCVVIRVSPTTGDFPSPGDFNPHHPCMSPIPWGPRMGRPTLKSPAVKLVLVQSCMHGIEW